MNEARTFEAWCPRELVAWAARSPGIEGITLSGGDPFDQPIHLLAEFVREVRDRTPLSLMCYTGRTLEQLRQEVPPASLASVLDYVDLLVDGPYVEALDDGSLWRGSRNQRFHYLSARYAALSGHLEARRGRPVEIRISESDEVEITGVPPRGAMESIRRAVASLDADLVPVDDVGTPRP
jgi:anaerobic ribonucleoside-triphosphate reductase activating protein